MQCGFDLDFAEKIDQNTEAKLVVQALRINTMSKLTFSDSMRFDALLRDVFPGNDSSMVLAAIEMIWSPFPNLISLRVLWNDFPLAKGLSSTSSGNHWQRQNVTLWQCQCCRFAVPFPILCLRLIEPQRTLPGEGKRVNRQHHTRCLLKLTAHRSRTKFSQCHLQVLTSRTLSTNTWRRPSGKCARNRTWRLLMDRYGNKLTKTKKIDFSDKQQQEEKLKI